MTKRYTIENRRSAVVLGVYEADSPQEALDKMAQDAGYESYAALCEEVPGELVVTEEDLGET